MQAPRLIEEIKKEYPGLTKARMLLVQSSYEGAAEAYSELLQEMSGKEGENSPKLALVYIEYASALIYSGDKLVLNPALEEDIPYIEDLEIAWEVLEVAKRIFAAHAMHAEQIQALLFLADLSLENNSIIDARNDITQALGISEALHGPGRDTAQILFRLALVEEAAGNTEKAAELLDQVLCTLKSLPSSPETDELVGEVEERKRAISHPDEYRIQVQTRPHTPLVPELPVKKLTIKRRPEPEAQPEHKPGSIHGSTQQEGMPQKEPPISEPLEKAGKCNGHQDGR